MVSNEAPSIQNSSADALLPSMPETTAADEASSDLHAPAEFRLPAGGRAMVVADLHLDGDPTPAQAVAVAELARAIESWRGPGVLIFNGNTFDTAGQLVGSDHHTNVERLVSRALNAHHRLERAVQGFAAEPQRQVLVLPGDRDPYLSWSEPVAKLLQARLGAQVLPAVDLAVDTGEGQSRVRVEPGHQLDPLARRQDPTNPGESPLSQHLRLQLLPAVRRSETGGSDRRGWLNGMERLDDPASFPRFLASRLAYRKLGRNAWLALVPVLVVLALGFPPLHMLHAEGWSPGEWTRLLIFLVGALVELGTLAVIGLVALTRTWRAVAGLSLGEGEEREPNRPARDRARSLIADRYRGLVTGYTCRPELVHLGTGFFANAGCGAEVVVEVPARLPGLGLPPVFLAYRQLSWVELEAGNELHVQLFYTRQKSAAGSFIERLVAHQSRDLAPTKQFQPRPVAAFPDGRSWPSRPSGQIRRRRIRRAAGIAVGVAGFASLLSSWSLPLPDRLSALSRVLPLEVPQTAAALIALAGLGLLLLARGVRRGLRRAWAVSLVVLLAATALHLVKAVAVPHLANRVDIEVASLAGAVALFLWANRADFRGQADPLALRGGFGLWAGALAATVAAGTLGIELGVAIRDRTPRRFDPSRFSIGWGRAAVATLERLVGIDHVYLPSTINTFFSPAVTTVGVALGLGLLALAFRPVVMRGRTADSHDVDLRRAREVVERYGSGTLDYFALRPDKQFFFWGDTVTAYAVYGGVCLVSPDPVGPVPERQPAWRAFRQFVDEHGWVLGGLGAGEDWLAVYRDTGMRDLYVGDEGVVRIDGFSLQGGKFKSLRQAVNRVARHGYRVTFHDPACLDPSMRSALERVMTRSRRGDVERGFSMTLGRAFDPADRGLLLAVAHAPGQGEELGEPVAFCQYVPAPGIGGYSLDLMRRDAGNHPNGLIDFVVVESIRYLHQRGAKALGLNFATMRAVLAGEAGDGLAQRVQAGFLRRMGDSMQVESLWKFNAKFDPDWQPRFAVYDAPEHALAIALAIARAESWWEIPVIGRFLRPARSAENVPSGATVRQRRLDAWRGRTWVRRLLGWPGALSLVAAAALAWVALVEFHRFGSTSIVYGWFLDTVVTLGVLGLIIGLVGRSRRWWLTWGLGTAAASVGVVALAAWWVRHIGLVDQHYPPSFLAWGWGAVWATALAVTGWWSGALVVRVVRLLTAPIVVLASFCLVNSHYGYWPSLGALLGRPAAGQVSARLLQVEIRADDVSLRSHSHLGVYGPLSVSGSGVGFQAATMYVWLPPNFDRVSHADLPVLFMLPGWPGNVQDWVRAGRALDVANRWAAAHHGAAPVMVFVDENGAHGYDTECVNGPQGNAETYLTQVVPTYLQQNLGVVPDAHRWAVIGFSEGGTCAVGLGTEVPHLFGRFVDMAGDLAPSYGFNEPVRVTLGRLYGGSVVAMRLHNPIELLATHRYARSIGWFTAGREDRHCLLVARRLAPAAAAAGMKVHLLVTQGGHSWTEASQAFSRLYPSLVRSLAPSPTRKQVAQNGRLVTSPLHRPPVSSPDHPKAR